MIIVIYSRKERGSRIYLVPLISGTRSCLVPLSEKKNVFLPCSSKKGTRSREWRSQKRFPNALHVMLLQHCGRVSRVLDSKSQLTFQLDQVRYRCFSVEMAFFGQIRELFCLPLCIHYSTVLLILFIELSTPHLSCIQIDSKLKC